MKGGLQKASGHQDPPRRKAGQCGAWQCSGRISARVLSDASAGVQERFYFGDNVLPLFESGIPLLKERIAQLQDVTIAYPDEGAWKRFHSQFEQYPEVWPAC